MLLSSYKYFHRICLFFLISPQLSRTTTCFVVVHALQRLIFLCLMSIPNGISIQTRFSYNIIHTFFCTFNSSCSVKCERNIPSYRARPSTITPIYAHNTGRPEPHDRSHSVVTYIVAARLPPPCVKKITKSKKKLLGKKIVYHTWAELKILVNIIFTDIKKDVFKVMFDGCLMLFKIKH